MRRATRWALGAVATLGLLLLLAALSRHALVPGFRLFAPRADVAGLVRVASTDPSGLRAAFNAASDSVRLIALLSPT